MNKRVIIGGLAMVVAGGVWLDFRNDAGDAEKIEKAAESGSTLSEKPGRSPKEPRSPVDLEKPAKRIDAARRQRLLVEIRRALKQRNSAQEPQSGSEKAGNGVRAAGQPAPRLGSAGSLDSKYIREQVKEIVPLFAECYESARVRKPELEGKITVSFTIIGDEDVGALVADSAVDNKASDIVDPDFLECVRETVYALELDVPPSGGGQVTVHYPFRFTPRAPGGTK